MDNKKIFRRITYTLAILSCLAGAAFAQDAGSGATATTNAGSGTGTGAAVTIDRPLHDFGTFRKGESRVTEFTVTNTGDAPLLLSGVRTTCNCTKIRWSRRPIAPGESQQLTVTYKAQDAGAFYKEIEIKTNADPQMHYIRVKGVIIP